MWNNVYVILEKLEWIQMNLICLSGFVSSIYKLSIINYKLLGKKENETSPVGMSLPHQLLRLREDPPSPSSRLARLLPDCPGPGDTCP